MSGEREAPIFFIVDGVDFEAVQRDARLQSGMLFEHLMAKHGSDLETQLALMLGMLWTASMAEMLLRRSASRTERDQADTIARVMRHAIQDNKV